MQIRVVAIIFCCINVFISARAALRAAEKNRRDSQRIWRVGAIFENGDEIQEIAFKKGLEAANEVLKSGHDLYMTSLEPAIARIDVGDSFAANTKTCEMLEKGVVAIVGPSSPQVSSHVQKICDRFYIPRIEIQWGYLQNDAIYNVNLHPYYKSFGKAILDYMKTVVQLDGLAIIYHEEDGLVKFEEVLNRFKTSIIIRRWQMTNENDVRYLMKSLKESLVRRFIIDIPLEHVKDYLIAASNFNMTTDLYSYIFTTWDLTKVDLRSFKVFSGANITTFMITPYVADNEEYNVDPKFQPTVRAIRNEVQKLHSSNGMYSVPSRMIPTKAALIYDAIQLLANALVRLSRARSVMLTGLSCKSKGTWAHGSSVINYLKSTDVKPLMGLTGPILLDSSRQRSNFTLYMYEVSKKGYRMYGNWTLGRDLHIRKNANVTKQEVRETLKKKTLRVTTVADEPFVILEKTDKAGNPLPGEDSWNGFCIEILKHIAKDLQFNYSIHLVRDGQYGKENGTKNGKKTWNGMIGELMDGTADLALASLTITYERERVIDFTTPFMNLGLTILFSKPKASNPHLFSFLQPLSPAVWGYVLAAYVLVSGILFVVARFSPYEWFNPHPCNPDSDVVENQFNILNSFWFTIASFLQQGSEHAPKSISTRMVAGIWWFFGLIVISSYTANLAAFLTVERMKAPIESAEDLAKQTRIKYGTLQGGSTYSFFKRSEFPTFKKMFDFMNNNENSFVTSTKAGIDRVHQGNYAFIMESTMNEYYRARNCSLIQIGDKLDSKGYGIGLPSGSQYRDIISESILKLQKKQVIDEAYRKFWFKYKIKTPCTSDEGAGSASSLRVEQVGGVFVVLLMGMLLAIMCSVCEFFYKSRKNAHPDDHQEPVCTELGKELRFAMRCMASSKKPIKKSRDDNAGRGGTADSSSRMRMLMEPPPSMMRDDRASGRWFAPSDERFGANGTQIDHTPRYSPKYPVAGNMSPYPASADFNYGDSRYKKVPC